MKRLLALLVTSVFIVSLNSWAEAPAAGQPQPQTPAALRSLFVLPTTDTSEYNLGQALQSALSTLFQQTQGYNVQFGTLSMGGFTEPEVTRARQLLNADILSFVYLEKERLTLFLFDSQRPREFVVASQPLIDPMLGNQVTPQVIEYKLRMGFNQLLTQFSQNHFQPLPGSEADKYLSSKEPDDPKVRSETARRLFRELAALQESKYYAGASIGMARFSGTTPAGENGSSSNVNFGGYFGAKLGERTRCELGLSLFNYALIHLDGFYILPLAEKYLSFALSAGIGQIMGTVAQPRGQSPRMQTGSFLFGPGFSFDVPLLGANIRGELKFYLGGGTLLVGTYGLSYSL